MQGIKWIRTKESSPERNLEVVRLGQPDMLRKLERALENGCVPIDAVLDEIVTVSRTGIVVRAHPIV